MDARAGLELIKELGSQDYWLAVLVTFGIRSNIAALVGGVAFVMSAAFFTNVLHLSGTWALLPGLGFGLGAIGLAKNPEGVVYTFTRWVQGHIHGASGVRTAPAASGFSGPDDPRLPPPPPPPGEPEEQTAEVTPS